MSGLVYYVLDATAREQRVKIGFTTQLGARLPALAAQTMSRQTPLVLALEAGTYQLETFRHNQFASLWCIGEWFRYDGGLREMLAAMEHPTAYVLNRPELWAYAQGWQNFTGWKAGSRPPGVSAAEGGTILTSPDDPLPVEYEPKPVEF